MEQESDDLQIVGTTIDLTEESDDEFYDLTNNTLNEIPDEYENVIDIESGAVSHRDVSIVNIVQPEGSRIIIPDVDVNTYFQEKHNSKRTETNNQPSCPICMITHTKIKNDGDKIIATLCGHVFCRKCIEQVMKTNKKCPTCRLYLRGPSAFHNIYI